MPTFNKVDMMNCAAGHHDFSDDSDECHVCGHKDDVASSPAAVDLETWAKSLSDAQLTAAIYEMRNRGAAVAYYDAGEILTMIDGWGYEPDEKNLREWMAENRDAVEEAMCDAAREIFEEEAPLGEPEEDEEVA